MEGTRALAEKEADTLLRREKIKCPHENCGRKIPLDELLIGANCPMCGRWCELSLSGADGPDSDALPTEQPATMEDPT